MTHSKALFTTGMLLAIITCIPLQAQVSFGTPQKFNEQWLFSLTDDSLSRRNDYDDSQTVPYDEEMTGGDVDMSYLEYGGE